MKTTALIFCIAALGFAQSVPAPKFTPHKPLTPPPSAQKKKPEPAAKPLDHKAETVPAGAVQVEPYLYRYTDSNGKTWMYRQTPFGIAKWDADAPAAPPPPPASAPVTVTDLGDSYRFVKKTPFGGSTWVHKKTELTDDDKTLLKDSAPDTQAAKAAPAESEVKAEKEEK